MPNNTPWTQVTDARALDELANQLAQHKLLAVDTESNSLHAFREQVCLIQFTADQDYLVDPLALDNLDSLAAIFSDPKIEKIFHAAEYDLMVLQRDYSYRFANLFDTMIAARILGRRRVGLGNMLEEVLGIKLAKKFQRADWGKRPLSTAMLDYARLDTHYLIELRHKLKSELERSGRWPLAEEDFRRLPHTVLEPPGQGDVEIWRIKGAYKMKRQEQAILQKLAEYRAQQAEKRDVPLFKVLGDNTLTAIAEDRPGDLKALAEIPGMSKGQIGRHGKALLRAIAEGCHAPAPERPQRERYDDDYAERLEALRNWRKQAAKPLEVESDVVLPRDLMEELARANPRTSAQVAEILAMVPFRLEKYGDQILQTIQNSH